jgi:hypothetical protein
MKFLKMLCKLGVYVALFFLLIALVNLVSHIDNMMMTGVLLAKVLQ